MSNARETHDDDRLLARTMSIGSSERPLTDAEARTFIQQAFEHAPADGKRVLAVIPDGTRTAPMPLLYRLLYEVLGEDRKSTRLNSSHVAISYAVFCLK